MPTVYVADNLYEYNPEKHQDILQLVPKYELDEAQKKIEELENCIKTNVMIVGLESEITLLKAKLELAIKQRDYEMTEPFHLDEEMQDSVEFYNQKLNSITLESLKYESAKASAKNQMELSKVLDDNEDR